MYRSGAARTGARSPTPQWPPAADIGARLRRPGTYRVLYSGLDGPAVAAS